MKTLFNTPKTASQAAFIVRIISRAQSLFTTGGYTKYDMGDGQYSVVKPGCEEAFPFGDYGYDVCTVPGKQHCTCGEFARSRDCKHRIACALAEDAAEKAEADACEMDIDSYRRWKEDNEARELCAA
jgi:hypothetical protein